MQRWVGSLSFVAVAAAVISSVACSSSSNSPLGSGSSSGDGTASGSSGSDTGSGDNSGSSGSGLFQEGDAQTTGNGTCKTGYYTGTFTCGFVYDPDAGAVGTLSSEDAGSGGFPIGGNLAFELTQSISGELGQDTASGTFNLTAGITGATATLSGSLNCNTGQFSGALTGGMFDLNLLFVDIQGTFAGPLASTYDGNSASFQNGAWELSLPSYGTCPGTWSATYQGASADSGAADASSD
jgi:hypothetical protein